MRKKISVLFIFLFGFSFAQFAINGSIDNLSSSNYIKINLYTQTKPIIIHKINSENPNFKINVPFEYNGKIVIEDANGQSIELLTNNKSVSFAVEYQKDVLSLVEVKKGDLAKKFVDYQTYLKKKNIQQNMFQFIQGVYQPNETFYKEVEKESNRIDNIKENLDLDKFSLLSNYVKQRSFLDRVKEANKAGKNLTKYKDSIVHALQTKGEFIENTALLSPMVMNYLEISLNGARTQQEYNSRISQAVDKLTSAVDMNTKRGQNIAASFLYILPKDSYGLIVENLLKQVESCDCKKTEELDLLLSASKIKEGNIAPNFTFATQQKGAKDLYSVKANKKLLVFWSSWCPACVNEVPYIKEFYTNFSNNGGEIVGVSLDYDEKAYKNAIADFGWINHSDLLKWDGPTSALFGVNSTPTFIMLDKDNKILKIANRLIDIAAEEDL